MIQEKLESLRLQLNYTCYDSEMLSKLNKVWESFYELETEVKKLQQHSVMQAEGSDGAVVAAVASGAAGQNGSDGIWCKYVSGKRCECEADSECTLL
jgi:hypothetical protein